MKKAQTKNRKAGQIAADEILPEYDFKRGRPNKYAERYAEGSTVVVLDPDVAAVFPTAEEVNEALRAVAGVIRKRQARQSPPRRDG